jgi:hypothetical protein
MPRTNIPAKKHHLAREGFFRNTLVRARSTLKIAAAKGRNEKSVTCPSTGEVKLLLLAPQPPQQQKQGNQGQREKERSTPAVNGAVDHLGPDIYAKQSDDCDPEAVPQDSQGNHERHEHGLSPPGS